MADTRNASLLNLEKFTNEQLEKIRDEINIKLTKVELPNFKGSRTQQPSFFTPVNNSVRRQEEVAELLKYVKNADYNAIKIITNQNPILMFLTVDGQNISPLQFAFNVYDTYTWKEFYERIKDQPKFVEKFYEQADQQTQHINLDPLFKAYVDYDIQYKDGGWRTDDRLYHDINIAWANLGKKQHGLLPMHMLREFCREGDSWGHQSTFDVTQLPAPIGGNIYNYHYMGQETPLSVDAFKSDLLESDIALVRVTGHDLDQFGVKAKQTMCLWAGGLVGVTEDQQTFRHLYLQRIADLSAQLLLRDQHQPRFVA